MRRAQAGVPTKIVWVWAGRGELPAREAPSNQRGEPPGGGSTHWHPGRGRVETAPRRAPDGQKTKTHKAPSAKGGGPDRKEQRPCEATPLKMTPLDNNRNVGGGDR